MSTVQVIPVPGIPLVREGDDLAALILDALNTSGQSLHSGDILCIAQKIVSKSEGRLVLLESVSPSAAAIELARETDKDPRMVELVLSESSEVVRKKPGVLITRHRLGLVGANAGIDQSNVAHDDGEMALLLPVDPDASAARLCREIRERCSVDIGVIITDSANRPWRLGTVGIAIGSAGFNVLDDQRGGHDMFGRELKVTLINRADTIATAALLVMGETIEKIPAAIVRGVPRQLPGPNQSQRSKALVRPLEEDLFR
ncbi:MAG: coenzyme F420-0:L-glutamate ligase [Pseudomonadales bacterium]|nr:coenzyme F420-0:L-glutamate ligase [Pseudomonadales bacterium]